MSHYQNTKSVISHDPALWGENPDGTRQSWAKTENEHRIVDTDNLKLSSYIGIAIASVANIGAGLALSLSQSGYNYTDTPGAAATIQLSATFAALVAPPVFSLINDLGTARERKIAQKNSDATKASSSTEEPSYYVAHGPSIHI